ncbi:MAG TPA: hypothetical protein VNQ77_19690 [Frankiaceae bacterium]|nr:hypothetical protein [Frankiaceae bacterium]
MSHAEPGLPHADVVGRIRDAAARADERLRDPSLTERIPGKSLAVVGYGVLLLAVLLELVPGSHGDRYLSFGWKSSKLGHVWDFAFLALAGAALAGRVLPQAKRLAHPALQTAVAVLALAQAYLLLDPSLIPLLVLVAALILTYDAVHTGLAAQARDTARTRLEAIPNATTAGLGACLVALAISKLPGKPLSTLGGVLVIGSSVTSLAWTLVLVAAGAAAIAADRGILKTPYDAWITGGATLLFAAWAWVLFNLSLVPLLWLAGAVVAIHSEYAKAKERTGGELTLRRLTQGPRLFVLAGVPLCLVALSFTWSKTQTSGMFMGGNEQWYSSYAQGYVTSYNYTKYYMPGINFSGTGLTQGPDGFSFSPLIVAALLALLVFALWVTTKPIPTWAYVVPGALVALVAVWTVAHMFDDVLGPWLFLPGLALCGLAAFTVGMPAVRRLTAPAA